MVSSQISISIIIPVLNQKQRLTEFLDKIINQDYPGEFYEIIVVDNGSTDGTWELLQNWPGIIVDQVTHPQSPYVCRNKGVELASGHYLLFLDANITLPSTSWLTKLLEIRTEEKLITVTKILPKNLEMTITQWCEIIAFFRFNNMAVQNKASLIVNMLVNKNWFYEVGFFEEPRSGGDTLWIQNALKQNFRLKLIPDLYVFYQPKEWNAYLKKMARIGYRNRTRLKEFSSLNVYFKIIFSMRPPNPFRVYKVLKHESMHNQSLFWYLKVLFAMWFFRVFQSSVTLGILNPESD